MILRLLLAVFLLFPITSMAKVRSVRVKKDQVIYENVYMVPGFGVKLEFPETIESFRNGGDEIVQCHVSKNPKLRRSATCKPRTFSENQTNIFVDTKSNSYIFKVTITNDQKLAKYYQYTYKLPALAKKKSVQKSQPKAGDSLVKGIAEEFTIKGCRTKDRSANFSAKCEGRFAIAGKEYVRFSVENESSKKGLFVKCGVAKIKKGGATGLKSLSSKIISEKCELPMVDIFEGMKVYGAIEVPSLETKDDEELVIHLVSSLGKENDIYLGW